MKTLDQLLLPPDVVIDLPGTNYGQLVAPDARAGVMWHYDASSSDAGALGWFRHRDFKLSYNRAYTDAGRRVRLTPSIFHRAYHAGRCKQPPNDTNAAFFALAVTAGAGDQVTDAQFAAIVYDTAFIFRFMRWTAADVEHRLVGHNQFAVFNQRDNPSASKLWGQLGRKPDPIGTDPNRPVLSLNAGRAAVAAVLDDATFPIWEHYTP